MQAKKFMNEALKEASAAQASGNWGVGCVITLDDKIIARGRNQVFTGQNRLLHAEMDAINKLQRHHFKASGKNLTLYTTLEPCPMCFGAILLAGIHTVVAGTNLDNSGASAYFKQLPEFFKQPRFKTTLTTGILAKECADIWLAGAPAQSLFERGYDISKLSDNKNVRTYTTPVKKSLHFPAIRKPNYQKWLQASRPRINSVRSFFSTSTESLLK